MDDDDFLIEIRADFLQEANEMLISAEESFLAFEQDNANDEAMANILRLFHSFKGGSKAVGLEKLANFAHKAEDFMILVRKGEISSTSEVMDFLLEINDRLKISLEMIDGDDANLNFSDIESKFKKFDSAEENEMSDEEALRLMSEMESGPTPQENTSSEITDEEAMRLMEEMSRPVEKSEKKPIEKLVSKPNESNEKSKKSTKTEESIKLSLNKIDQVINIFGQQTINQAKLNFLIEQFDIKNEEILDTVREINKNLQELQDTVIKLRMINLKSVYTRLDRVVRETLKTTGKKINFIKLGAEQELDKIIVDSLTDPLTHMVRNSIDHGIEEESVRVSNGKNPEGQVTIKAYQKAGKFFLELEDDGGGLDPEVIGRKAVEKGVVASVEHLSKSEIYNLIFENGFSTREQATDVSGRGVGMDVVRKMFIDLKGSCVIDSEKGKGTKFTIELPLSLSMFNGIVCAHEDSAYVLANSDIKEIISLDPIQFNLAENGMKMFSYNNEETILISLATNSKTMDKSKIAVIVESSRQTFAIQLDEIIGQERIVLKDIDPRFKYNGPYSGGVILGDGKVAMVLDKEKLINKYRKVA